MTNWNKNKHIDILTSWSINILETNFDQSCSLTIQSSFRLNFSLFFDFHKEFCGVLALKARGREFKSPFGSLVWFKEIKVSDHLEESDWFPKYLLWNLHFPRETFQHRIPSDQCVSIDARHSFKLNTHKLSIVARSDSVILGRKT